MVEHNTVYCDLFVKCLIKLVSAVQELKDFS